MVLLARDKLLGSSSPLISLGLVSSGAAWAALPGRRPRYLSHPPHSTGRSDYELVVYLHQAGKVILEARQPRTRPQDHHLG